MVVWGPKCIGYCHSHRSGIGSLMSNLTGSRVLVAGGGAVCPLLLLPASISVMQIEIFHFKPYNSFTSEVDSRACGA